jgi:hypothetical protein
VHNGVDACFLERASQFLGIRNVAFNQRRIANSRAVPLNEIVVRNCVVALGD